MWPGLKVLQRWPGHWEERPGICVCGGGAVCADKAPPRGFKAPREHPTKQRHVNQRRFECWLGQLVCMREHVLWSSCLPPLKGPSLAPGCQPIFSFSTSDGASCSLSCSACHGDQEPEVPPVLVGILLRKGVFCVGPTLGVFYESLADQCVRAVC